VGGRRGSCPPPPVFGDKGDVFSPQFFGENHIIQKKIEITLGLYWKNATFILWYSPFL
jgi:hypothetical protein